MISMRILLIFTLLLLSITACDWNDRILTNQGEARATEAVAELYPDAILIEEVPLRCEDCHQYVFQTGKDIIVKATTQDTDVVEVAIIEGETLYLSPEECDGVIADGCVPGEVEMGTVTGVVSGVCCVAR